LKVASRPARSASNYPWDEFFSRLELEARHRVTTPTRSDRRLVVQGFDVLCHDAYDFMARWCFGHMKNWDEVWTIGDSGPMVRVANAEQMDRTHD
jgi:hypothetical protein